MEKGSYSINDLMSIIAHKNFRVGDVLYFRSDDLIKKYGRQFEIEIEFQIVKMINDTLVVKIKRYWDGNSKDYVWVSNDDYFIPKQDYHNIHRNSKFC